MRIKAERPESEFLKDCGSCAAVEQSVYHKKGVPEEKPELWALRSKAKIPRETFLGKIILRGGKIWK